MITDEEVERAVDWLRDNAEEAAQARADRVHLEQFRKSKKAMLMKDCNESSIGAQEVYAYAHQEYLALLDGLKEAVKRDAKMQFLREAAAAKIEAWRTMNANMRSVKL